jgi:hypothetical protein
MSIATICLWSCGTYSVKGEPTPETPALKAPLITLRTLVLVGPGYQKISRYKTRIAQRLSSVSQNLRRVFGLNIKLMSIDAWSIKPSSDDRVLMKDLRRLNDRRSIDLVLGFVSGSQTRSKTAGDYKSQYGEFVILVRSQSPRFERQPDMLHVNEVRAIMAGIGQTFGVLPSCNGHIMDPKRLFAPNAPYTWHPFNYKQIQIHLKTDRSDHKRGRFSFPLEARKKSADLLATLKSTHTCPPGLAAVGRRDLLKAIELKDEKSIISLDLWRQSQCHAMAPADTAISDNCAGQKAEREDRKSKAIELYRAHVMRFPEDVITLRRLARLTGKIGDDEAAIVLFLRVLKLKPNDEKALLNLGVAFARLGRYAPARQSWQKLLRINPEHMDAKSLLRQIPH